MAATLSTTACASAIRCARSPRKFFMTVPTMTLRGGVSAADGRVGIKAVTPLEELELACRAQPPTNIINNTIAAKPRVPASRRENFSEQIRLELNIFKLISHWPT